MVSGNSSLPGVIAVGSNTIYQLLESIPAQWALQPFQSDVAHMWESLSGGRVDSGSRILIFTDADSEGLAVQDAELLAIARAMKAMSAAGATVFHIAGSQDSAQSISQYLTDLRENDVQGKPDNQITVIPPGATDDEIIAIIRAVAASFVDFTQPSVVEQGFESGLGLSIPVIPALPPIGAARTQPLASRNVEHEASFDVSNHESKELLNRPRLPGQTTITVTSSKGGSGKSTASILLAASIASASEKTGNPLSVCLVDLDTRDGQVASMIGQFMPTALNIRVQPIWDEERIRRNLVRAQGLGIDTLLAPIRPRTADTVGPDFYRSIVRSLQRMYDVVVMDTSVQYLDPLIAEVALVEADEILFVTSLASTAVQGMARALREITAPIDESGLGIPREKLGIIVNQSVANVGMETDQVLAAGLGVPVVGVIPLATKDVLTATNLIQMHRLLEHSSLGLAYNELAIACLPHHNLAPWTPVVSSGSEQVGNAVLGDVPPSGANVTSVPQGTKKRGILRR